MRRLALAAATGALAIGLPALAQAETACADLAITSLPHATVTGADAETVDGKSICRIRVTSKPTADSDIGIEVWIPLGAAWNGKFVQYGNGGFAGSINSGVLRAAAARGYAAAGTDNGHRAPATNAAWALGHPEKLVDFGWRSLKETADIGKALVKAQKDSGPKLAYFQGCSDGGREALMMAQRFPREFDGIVAGAPANYMTLLFGNGAAQQQALARPGAYLDRPALELLQSAALKQCGGEAFIRDPAACRFDPRQLQCRPGQSDGCLSPAQAAAARAIYEGRRDPRNGRIALAGVTPGAEALNGSWQAWITGPTRERIGEAASYQFSSNAFKYFAFQDPAFDFLKLDLGAQFDRARAKMRPIIDSDDPDLSDFRRRGGKLIQWHGWNDPAIPAASSIKYHAEVQRRMGDTADFYRMYLIPGMLHCGGGAAPSQVDWLATLDAWVTERKAPGEITARSAANAQPPQTQLLCPYPAVARKVGQAWSCRR